MAIICHCKGVRERSIVKAIQHGASTVEDLRATCHAGTDCGGCEPVLAELLEQHTELGPRRRFLGAA